jgi:putative membrane protein insertion efficiency factor
MAQRSVVCRLLLVIVRGYQMLFSWHRTPACRFIPSCSEYAAEAIERYGAGRGALLAGRRLMRCRPGGPFGYDPVPENSRSASTGEAIH